MGGLLQEGVRRVSSVGVLLDGLQQERVSGDALHGHHQEEAQGGGVDVRPARINTRGSGENKQTGSSAFWAYECGAT